MVSALNSLQDEIKFSLECSLNEVFDVSQL